MDYSNVPAYLSTDHGTLVDNVMTDVAAASNPFTGLAAYVPTTDIASMLADVVSFEGFVAEVQWDDIYPQIIELATELVDEYINTDEYIADRVAAHAALLDTDLSAKVYPKFEAGMRDINAIMTSSFVIGRAIILVDRNDKVDRFSADMEMQVVKDRQTMITQLASEMLRIFLQKVEMQRALAALQLDFYRIKIAAKADEATENKAIEVEEAKWLMAKHQYAANVMSALNGGVSAIGQSEGSKTARVLGGALSGAAAGAMIGAAVFGEGSSGSGYTALLGGLMGGIGGGSM